MKYKNKIKPTIPWSIQQRNRVGGNFLVIFIPYFQSPRTPVHWGIEWNPLGMTWLPFLVFVYKSFIKSGSVRLQLSRWWVCGQFYNKPETKKEKTKKVECSTTLAWVVVEKVLWRWIPRTPWRGQMQYSGGDVSRINYTPQFIGLHQQRLPQSTTTSF